MSSEVKEGQVVELTGVTGFIDGKVKVVGDNADSANQPEFDMDENLTFLSDTVSESSDEAVDPAQSVVDMSEILDDKEKVRNGVAVPYKGKTKVVLARMNNTAYQTRLSKLYMANKHEIDKKTPEADKLAEHCTLQAIAECVVKGWTDMYLAGEQIAYSPKVALYLLKNSDDFRKFVQVQANSAANYYKLATNADKEHLKKLLTGV